MNPIDEELDREALLARVGGDPALAGQLLAQLREDLGDRLAAIREAMVSGDARAVHDACHPLKGALLSVDAGPAGEAARRVDEAARAGDMAAAREGFGELEEAVRRLERALEAWPAP